MLGNAKIMVLLFCPRPSHFVPKFGTNIQPLLRVAAYNFYAFICVSSGILANKYTKMHHKQFSSMFNDLVYVFFRIWWCCINFKHLCFKDLFANRCTKNVPIMVCILPDWFFIYLFIFQNMQQALQLLIWSFVIILEMTWTHWSKM